METTHSCQAEVRTGISRNYPVVFRRNTVVKSQKKGDRRSKWPFSASSRATLSSPFGGMSPCQVGEGLRGCPGNEAEVSCGTDTWLVTETPGQPRQERTRTGNFSARQDDAACFSCPGFYRFSSLALQPISTRNAVQEHPLNHPGIGPKRTGMDFIPGPCLATARPNRPASSLRPVLRRNHRHT